MTRIQRIALLLIATVSVTQLGLAQSMPTGRAGFSPPMLGAGVSHELATYRAAHIRNVRYELHLDVTRRDSAAGRVSVRFERAASGDAVLDFRGLGVDSIVANGTALSVRDHWNSAHIRLPAASLKTGENTIHVRFVSPIAPAGASIIRARDTSDSTDYLYTLLVPSDANLLFPCFDQPDLKARVTFSVTTRVGLNALANGSLVQTVTKDDRATHSFAETRPISTYLIAFAAGPWATITRTFAIAPGAAPVSISLWTRRSRLKEVEGDTLLATNARALVWLGNWFGVPYPFQKFDMLLAPSFPFGGMEHPGAIFYNEESFVYRERPTLTQLQGRQATSFHEVAHQWFGDFATMRWFDDLWLKEGFATYMAAKMQASLEPKANAWKSFYLRNKPVAYSTDATAGTTPVWQSLGNLDQAKSNYGPIVYNKAPSVLHQLDYLVGERAFQTGVRAFLKEHAYGNATWRDLLRSIGAASGRDLTKWGEQWILRPGMPIVEQQLTVRNGKITRLALVQRPAQLSVSGKGAWPIKMQLLLHYANGTPIRLPVELRTDTTVVAAAVGLRAPDFAFANDHDYGYALVLPDSMSVRWLENNVGSISDDFERAMLWGSLWDLVREARMSPPRFAAMAARELPRERDEQLASSITGRMVTTLTRYMSQAARDSMMPVVEPVLLAGATDTSRAYGQRKSQLDALISLARTPAAIARLDAWLSADTAAGIPLRPPTRWAIVTRLIAQRAPSADARLLAESKRDSTDEGKRLAFVAGAARPDAATKRAYFTRWFADRDLNEAWVTASLGAFNNGEQDALTREYLVPALDTLPWIQKNRRIFFLGSWLNAAIGGQSSEEALASLDKWLAAHPSLAADLKQKVLQSRDELERTVMVRRTFRM